MKRLLFRSRDRYQDPGDSDEPRSPHKTPWTPWATRPGTPGASPTAPPSGPRDGGVRPHRRLYGHRRRSARRLLHPHHRPWLMAKTPSPLRTAPVVSLRGPPDRSGTFPRQRTRLGTDRLEPASATGHKSRLPATRDDGRHSVIGRTLSHYRILAKLGANGMGDVYLAQDTSLKRQVALKILPTASSRWSGSTWPCRWPTRLPPPSPGDYPSGPEAQEGDGDRCRATEDPGLRPGEAGCPWQGPGGHVAGDAHLARCAGRDTAPCRRSSSRQSRRITARTSSRSLVLGTRARWSTDCDAIHGTFPQPLHALLSRRAYRVTTSPRRQGGTAARPDGDLQAPWRPTRLGKSEPTGERREP